MATANFVHDGKSIDYTPGADVTAGDVVVQNDLVGVAKLDIAANVLGALAVTGVFDLPKAAGVGEAIAAGTKVYWDVADGWPRPTARPARTSTSARPSRPRATTTPPSASAWSSNTWARSGWGRCV